MHELIKLSKKSTKPHMYYAHLIERVFETEQNRKFCNEKKTYVFVFHFIQYNIYLI